MTHSEHRLLQGLLNTARTATLTAGNEASVVADSHIEESIDAITEAIEKATIQLRALSLAKIKP